MRGFLGTSANLWSDLSLVFTLALGVVAAYGGIQAHRRRFSRHCPVMATAAILNWVPVLIVMIPRWLGVIATEINVEGLARYAPIFHGALGGVVQLLMMYTVTRMYLLEDLPPKDPIWLMRTTIGFWALALVGGISTYVLFYVR